MEGVRFPSPCIRGGMSHTIQFYFDFMSPYAYLAHAQLLALADRYRHSVEYLPVDLRRLKLAAGNTGPATREIPAKLKHLRVDMQRWARRYGVSLVPPAGYGSDRLNCGTFYAIDRDCARQYVQVAWDLVWGQGGDMAAPALAEEVAHRMGWDAAGFLAWTGCEAAQSRYRAVIDRAEGLGVFGVPSMLVGGEMWWGNDRLDFLEEHLAASSSGGRS